MGATKTKPMPTSASSAVKEKHRIKVLRQYAVLDSPPEQEFDELAAIAAHVCGAPIAMISLVDEHRQWFKAKVGVESTETPREHSFCAHALNQPELMIVPDAQQDERFVNNPLVTGDPGIRFYAGAPLISSKQATLGTLCVIDRVPRTLTSAQEYVMQSLASRVMNRLERRRLRATQKLPGVHLLKLEELRALVSTSPYRCAMWARLTSFLAWPILSGEISTVYVDGEFIADEFPKEIGVILQPDKSYGHTAMAAIKRYLDIGLDKILDLHCVRLGFWMENAPDDDTEYRSQLPKAPPLQNPYAPNSPWVNGCARINLRDRNIIPQFHDALDPYRI